MKKLLIIIAMTAAVTTTAVAREHSRATMAVSYRYDYPTKASADTIVHSSDDMLLLIAPDESRFYSVKTEFYDSIANSPGGTELIGQMATDALNACGGITRDANGNITQITVTPEVHEKMPHRGVTFNVYKLPVEGTMTVIDCNTVPDRTFYEYSVPMDSLAWKIADGTEIILGCECQKAVADFQGRRWEAWFAPEIAVAEGPWLLAGLPGLILHARSADGHYIYTATGMRQVDEAIKDLPGNPATEKVSGEQEFRERCDAARSSFLKTSGIKGGSVRK